MLAVDTNVVVRYLTRDDAHQAARAAALIDGEPVFIPTTVVLEAEWVLRTAYQFPKAHIYNGIRILVGQPTVTVEQPEALSRALAWAEQGVDFADALHLAASRHCVGFASFDRALAKSARNVIDMPVRSP